jgi:hypothetical protein
MNFEKYYKLNEASIRGIASAAAKHLDPWGKGGLLGRATTKAQDIETYLRGGGSNVGVIGHAKRTPAEINHDFNDLVKKTNEIIPTPGAPGKYSLKYNDYNQKAAIEPIHLPHSIVDHIIKIQTQYINHGHAHSAAMKEAASHFVAPVMAFANRNYIL